MKLTKLGLAVLKKLGQEGSSLWSTEKHGWKFGNVNLYVRQSTIRALDINGLLIVEAHEHLPC